MIPGILLALYVSSTTTNTHVAILAYIYIVTCVGSIVYHTYYAYYGFDSRMFRLDIVGQQALLYTGVLLSPLGLTGACMMLPVACIVTMCDFSKDVTFTYGTLVHALSVIVCTMFVSLQSAFQWLFAFMVYSCKHIWPESYTISQTTWHILCHINMASMLHVWSSGFV